MMLKNSILYNFVFKSSPSCFYLLYVYFYFMLQVFSICSVRTIKFLVKYIIFFIIIINMDVRFSLRVPRLISQSLKLIIM